MDRKPFLAFLIVHTGWVIFSLEIISDCYGYGLAPFYCCPALKIDC